MATTNFNFECDEPWSTQTLLQMRRRMMIRLGYAAQADDPPPGMAEEINDFLAEAQRLAWTDFSELHQTRYFSWTLAAGDRFVSFSDIDGACTKLFQAADIQRVAIRLVDTDAWMPLTRGIDVGHYVGGVHEAIPTRYDIRQGIELWPAPNAAMELMIRGRFGLLPFAADTDVTTIDSDALFLRALAVMKAHRGHADANSWIAQYRAHVGNLIASQHGEQSYVPTDGDTRRVDGHLTARFDLHIDSLEGEILVVGENGYLGIDP